MNSRKISRRQALVRAGLLAGTAVATRKLSAQDTRMKPTKPTDPFLFCLNTATIRGQKLGIVEEIDIAAKAGYNAIEPWVSAFEEYSKKGGDLKDLKKRVDDSGLVVASAIGFPEWIVDDDARRA
ncbi:MAG: Xylose isomerase domain protein barrel, partial [Verrucomicrobiales bacterium]|nr:Xylose isomerase domain protein barrel [Verrucomicrobiales bacterium]